MLKKFRRAKFIGVKEDLLTFYEKMSAVSALILIIFCVGGSKGETVL